VPIGSHSYDTRAVPAEVVESKFTPSSAPVSLSTPFEGDPGARCAYRCAIDRVRQPPSFWMLSKSTPAITSRLANVWRLQCQV
jgi:hypothetical protein